MRLTRVWIRIFILSVSADIEPEITGQRKESLHEMTVDLDGLLRGVRFHPAVPVGFVSGIGQFPQCSRYRFKNLQQASQLLT